MAESPKVRVLVAEDDFLIARTICGLLKERGYMVAGEAHSGQEAIEMTQSLRPDVVLMDVAIPDMDGIEASLVIQRICPTPVIILTAYEALSLVERAAAAGIAAYLVKPPNARQLERAIIIARARFGDLMELRRLNHQLQLINADLEHFSRTVAHDLRHLLSPIMGYAEILCLDYETVTPEEARKDLLTIVQATRDMNNLIDELLTLARARQEHVEVAPMDMAEVVSDVLRRMDYTIEEHHAQIITASDWPVSVGHAPWITEVWLNYLSNAIKYGGETPVVEMGWSPEAESLVGVYWSPPEEDEWRAVSQTGALFPPKSAPGDGAVVYFWVRDHGSGIAPDRLPDVFNAFTQLHQTKLRGHGLGLSIVKRIVERLGGRVGVKSALGMGSTFIFTLPLATDEPAGGQTPRAQRI